jgi:enoyl-CoA hydratase/carnithine racemase
VTGAIDAGELVDALDSAFGRETLVDRDPPLLFVTLDDAAGMDVLGACNQLAGLPLVVVGMGAPAVRDAPIASLVDTIAEGDALERITRVVAKTPIAATALAMLLRGATGRSVNDGLAAESAVYSTLQAGPEFEAWRRGHAWRDGGDDASAVRVERVGDELRVTLCRPAVHNALNTRMRDELYDALLVAVSDPTIHVLLSGDGPSFSSGGDLDEFGSCPDPATAHVIRLRRSVGRLIASIADRVTAVVHGACIGSGIELPAFAGHLVARPDARFGLPEIGFGLIPGAGGTVSMTRRIGRHRTALLALSEATIDAETALRWGLVDDIRTD